MAKTPKTVAIARTRLTNAKIVLMDEPTAAISVRQVAEVLSLIRRLRDQGIRDEVVLGAFSHQALPFEKLVDELRAREHEVELVTVPFKWYPGTKVLSQAFLWRLLDLSESDGRPIDLVIATKFPSYVVRHPNKRVWVLHQFRQAYELGASVLGEELPPLGTAAFLLTALGYRPGPFRCRWAALLASPPANQFLAGRLLSRTAETPARPPRSKRV